MSTTWGIFNDVQGAPANRLSYGEAERVQTLIRQICGLEPSLATCMSDDEWIYFLAHVQAFRTPFHGTAHIAFILKGEVCRGRIQKPRSLIRFK